MRDSWNVIRECEISGYLDSNISVGGEPPRSAAASISEAQMEHGTRDTECPGGGQPIEDRQPGGAVSALLAGRA